MRAFDNLRDTVKTEKYENVLAAIFQEKNHTSSEQWVAAFLEASEGEFKEITLDEKAVLTKLIQKKAYANPVAAKIMLKEDIDTLIKFFGERFKSELANQLTRKLCNGLFTGVREILDESQVIYPETIFKRIERFFLRRNIMDSQALIYNALNDEVRLKHDLILVFLANKPDLLWPLFSVSNHCFYSVLYDSFSKQLLERDCIESDLLNQKQKWRYKVKGLEWKLYMDACQDFARTYVENPALKDRLTNPFDPVFLRVLDCYLTLQLSKKIHRTRNVMLREARSVEQDIRQRLVDQYCLQEKMEEAVLMPGDDHLLSMLKEGVSPDFILQNKYRTPLMLAISRGDIAKIKLLLEYGADIHLRVDAVNAANVATRIPKAKVLVLLKNAGAVVDEWELFVLFSGQLKTGEKFWRLMKEDNVDEIRHLLLKYQLDPAKINKDQRSFLYYLVLNNSKNVIKLVIEEFNLAEKIPEKEYKDCLQVALANESFEIATYLRQTKTESFWEDFECPPSLFKALLKAIKNEDFEKINLIVNVLKFNVNFFDDNKSALLYAVKNRRSLECVQFLLEKCNAFPDYIDNSNQTALDHATAAGRQDIVDCLLAHGADPVVSWQTAAYITANLMCTVAARGGASIFKLGLHFFKPTTVETAPYTIFSAALDILNKLKEKIKNDQVVEKNKLETSQNDFSLSRDYFLRAAKLAALVCYAQVKVDDKRTVNGELILDLVCTRKFDYFTEEGLNLAIKNLSVLKQRLLQPIYPHATKKFALYGCDALSDTRMNNCRKFLSLFREFLSLVWTESQNSSLHENFSLSSKKIEYTTKYSPKKPLVLESNHYSPDFIIIYQPLIDEINLLFCAPLAKCGNLSLDEIHDCVIDVSSI